MVDTGSFLDCSSVDDIVAIMDLRNLITAIPLMGQLNLYVITIATIPL